MLDKEEAAVGVLMGDGGHGTGAATEREARRLARDAPSTSGRGAHQWDPGACHPELLIR